MEVEFDDYDDIDEIEVDGYADEDSQYIGGDYSDGDDWDPAGFQLYSQAPVATGHEYGMESDGYACFDDGDGEDYDDCDWYEVGVAYASVNVVAPTPQITSLSTYSVNQGDQGTLTVTGSNFIENASDQLTLNFSGGSSPFTLASTPSTCTTTCTASYSYNFTGYPAGTYTLSVSKNEGTSNSESFTVIYTAPPSPPSSSPLSDPCAVTLDPQVGSTYFVSTGTAGGSGTTLVISREPLPSAA